MTSMAWIALGVATVAALADWYAVARGNRRLEYIAKPLTMVALAAVALTLDPVDPTRRLWFAAAVVFSLAGDVFLMMPRDRFLPGVAAFLVAHLCYVGGLLRGDISPAGLLLGTALMVVALVVTGRPLLLALQRRQSELRVPVAVYMVAISAMVVLAVAVGPLASAVGAVLFAASDSILARDRFVRPIAHAALIVMVTYHLGQAGLVLSLVTPAAAPADAPTPTAAPAATEAETPPATEAETEPAPLPDGVVAEVQGGLLYIIWDGTKERIQQPAPLDDATVEELGLQVQPPIDELTARPQPDPRTFWVVYPATGGKARLHLAVADRLYPIQTVAAQARQVDRLPDAPDSLLNRMRPAG